MFSIIESSSFGEIPNLYESVLRAKEKTNVPMVLIGNKADLESQREVSSQQGRDLAKQFGCSYYETSALTGANIDDAFCSIIRCIKQEEGTAELKPKKKSKRKDCMIL